VPPVAPDVLPLPLLLLLDDPVDAPVEPDIVPEPAEPVEFVMLPVVPVPALVLGETLPLTLLLVPAEPAGDAFVAVLGAVLPVAPGVLLWPLTPVFVEVWPLTVALPPAVLGLEAAPPVLVPTLVRELPLTPVAERSLPVILIDVLPGVIVDVPSVTSER